MPIKVDDDGVGGSVTDQLNAAGYNVIPVSAARKANAVEIYPNRRSELWFSVAERARDNELDLSGILRDTEGNETHMIDEEVLEEIKRQAMALTWLLDSRGRRVVCSKDEQKQKLGRSPDGMDALNLAYAETPEGADALPEILTARQSPLGRR